MVGRDEARHARIYGHGGSTSFVRWCIGTQASMEVTWETFPKLGGFALCLLLLCLSTKPHGFRLKIQMPLGFSNQSNGFKGQGQQAGN